MSTTTTDRWRWLAFAAALAATLMDLLDATIANVAAPSIRGDLGGSYADVQWLSAAYTLAMAVMLLTGGRLGDMFGRKRDAARRRGRLHAGLGRLRGRPVRRSAHRLSARSRARLGAVMVPQVFGLIRDLFAPQEMGKAFGILGPACGLRRSSALSSPGVLIDADLFGTGWRMIFLINVPVGAFVLVAGARFLPTSPRAPRRGGWT